MEKGDAQVLGLGTTKSSCMTLLPGMAEAATMIRLPPLDCGHFHNGQIHSSIGILTTITRISIGRPMRQ